MSHPVVLVIAARFVYYFFLIEGSKGDVRWPPRRDPEVSAHYPNVLGGNMAVGGLGPHHTHCVVLCWGH